MQMRIITKPDTTRFISILYNIVANMQRETIPIPAADSQGDTAARNFWRTDYSSRNWAKQQGYTLWRRIQQEDE